MRNIEKRIKRGHEAITRAKSEGRDITEWEKHLEELEKQLIEEIVGIQLSELAKRNMALEVYSEILGATIWICSNEEMAAQIRKDDPEAICYTTEEVRKLIKLNPIPEDIKRIHEAKSVFREAKIIESNLEWGNDEEG